jgi:hypothetical protein
MLTWQDSLVSKPGSGECLAHYQIIRRHGTVVPFEPPDLIGLTTASRCKPNRGSKVSLAAPSLTCVTPLEKGLKTQSP